MRRVGIILAALLALAVAVAPIQASGASPCPCHAAAPADCPCHGGCDIQAGLISPCHCAAAVAWLPAAQAVLGKFDGEHRWLASKTPRLLGNEPPPPLRPPIFT